jgi:hypothetical protein
LNSELPSYQQNRSTVLSLILSFRVSSVSAPPTEVDGPSHGVWLLFSAPRTGDPDHPSLPHSAPSAFRVSHPPDGLRPPAPSGPISCRSRSRGFAFKAFPSYRAFEPSRARCLLDVSLGLATPKSQQASTHLQGLTPCRNPPLPVAELTAHRRPLPSWRSAPSRGFSPAIFHRRGGVSLRGLSRSHPRT